MKKDYDDIMKQVRYISWSTYISDNFKSSDLKTFMPVIKLLNSQYGCNIKMGEGTFKKSFSPNKFLYKSKCNNLESISFCRNNECNKLNTLFFDNRSVIVLKRCNETIFSNIEMFISFKEQSEQLVKIKRILFYFKKMIIKEYKSHKFQVHDLSSDTAILTIDDFNNLILNSIEINFEPLYFTKKTLFRKKLIRDKEIYYIKIQSFLLKLIFKNENIIDIEIESQDFNQFIDYYSIDLNGDEEYFKSIISLIEINDI